MQACMCRKLFLDYPLLIRDPQLGILFWVSRPREYVIEWMQPPTQTFFLLVTQSFPTKSAETSNKKRRPITAHFKIWEVHFELKKIQRETQDSRTQAAQAHDRNADVTLACERCCVTNGYLQRLVWDVNGFSLKQRKNVIFLDKINLPYCLVVFFVVCPRLRPF